jgi:hypothetical protein
MAVLSWPASLPLKPRTNSLSGGPRRMVASFEPEQGIEITRPRVTAAIHVIDFETPSLTKAQMVTLRTFFEETTKGGALSFCLLDPRTDEAWLWKPVPGDGPYRESDMGVNLTGVALSLVRQPGRPWWSTYCLTTVSTVPLMVLDFQNSVHGRPATKETLVALQAAAPVLGTVDIRRTDTSGVVTTQDGVVVDGAWWAALVPASWRSIVVFPDGTF